MPNPSHLDLRNRSYRLAVLRLIEAHRAEFDRFREEEDAKTERRPRRGHGEGTLEQRGPERWRLRAYLGNNAAHQAVQVSRTVKAKNKTEALRELRKFVAEIEQNKVKVPRGPKATVETLLVDWLRHLERTGRAPSTVDSYRLIVNNHLVPALGAMLIERVDGKVLDDYYAAKNGPGGAARRTVKKDPTQPEKESKALSANTIRVHHAVLSSAFTQAVKWRWLAANPCEQATPPQKQKPDRQSPDPGRVRALIDACGKDRELAIAISLGAVTGARRGELCGLQWHDVDWQAGTLHIRRQRQPAKGGDRTVPPKTKRPPISLGAGGLALLRKYRYDTEERAEALGVTIADDGWLISPNGLDPMRPRMLGEAIAALSARSGVRITTHLLRYFAATQMVGAGVDVRTAAGRLGHTPEILLRVYADFMPRRDLEAAVGLETLVLAPNEKKPPAGPGADVPLNGT